MLRFLYDPYSATASNPVDVLQLGSLQLSPSTVNTIIRIMIG